VFNKCYNISITSYINPPFNQTDLELKATARCRKTAGYSLSKRLRISRNFLPLPIPTPVCVSVRLTSSSSLLTALTAHSLTHSLPLCVCQQLVSLLSLSELCKLLSLPWYPSPAAGFVQSLFHISIFWSVFCVRDSVQISLEPV